MKKFFEIILFTLLVTFVFASCTSDVPNGQKSIKLYYTNLSHDSLEAEYGYIAEPGQGDVVSLVKTVLNKLLEGPSSSDKAAVIPEGITVRGVSLSQYETGTVNVDLSGDYYEGLKKSEYVSDELLARYSIICTLCQFDEINRVKLYINRQDLRSNYGEGEAIISMGSDSVLMNSPSSVETQTEKFVTLYFTDKAGKKLYPETRKATMTDNSIEKTIVNELIRGPVSHDLERTLSADSELVSIETTEEICFVNFASGFMDDVENGSDKEKIILYSIVNSLTRLESITKVQILIDGKKMENDAHQLFSNPVERNIYMIDEGV